MYYLRGLGWNGGVNEAMRNWMSMARGAATTGGPNSIPMPLLSPAPSIHKTIIPFSLTKTTPFLISFPSPSPRFLSSSSSSADHNFNFSDSGHYLFHPFYIYTS